MSEKRRREAYEAARRALVTVHEKGAEVVEAFTDPEDDAEVTLEERGREAVVSFREVESEVLEGLTHLTFMGMKRVRDVIREELASDAAAAAAAGL